MTTEDEKAQPVQGDENPELCVHVLSVDDDMTLLCCKNEKRVSCTGPCADFVDAFVDDDVPIEQPTTN